MKVINFFAPPSGGKSTTGQILSGLLSIAGYNVEYVPEFAKFATLSRNESALSDQIYMFGKQENRLHVLRRSGADFVVMDGPLPNALLFQPDGYFPLFEPFVMQVFDSFENLNYLLEPSPNQPYRQFGRNEDSEGAQVVKAKMMGILDKYRIPVIKKMVNEQLPFEIRDELVRAFPLHPLS